MPITFCQEAWLLFLVMTAQMTPYFTVVINCKAALTTSATKVQDSATKADLTWGAGDGNANCADGRL